MTQKTFNFERHLPLCIIVALSQINQKGTQIVVGMNESGNDAFI
jgi:hypothetical protein